MNYTSKDKPFPRGEVCYRGPNVFPGYLNQPDKTKEALDDDGWLHSGDIGCWLENGALKIIDRKKNIFKLSQGEYIAPEKIEQVYAAHALVAQAFVYGSSLEHQLVGVIVPDFETCAGYFTSQKWEVPKLEDGKIDMVKVCEHAEFKAHLLKDVVKMGKEKKLSGLENIKAVHLEPEPFSVENEILTPTFKLKRNVAGDKYEEQIRAMYGSLDGAQGAGAAGKSAA